MIEPAAFDLNANDEFALVPLSELRLFRAEVDGCLVAVYAVDTGHALDIFEMLTGRPWDNGEITEV